jgi:putative transposase
MEARLSGHSVYRTEYHIVWIPKYRYRILNPGVKGYLEKILPMEVKAIPGCEIVEMNIQPEHIHMVAIIPPKYAVSEVVGRIKGKTASRLRKKFWWLRKRYQRENVVWSPGYFVSTVGIDEEKILNYVRWQEHQDSGQAKLEL